MSAEYPSGKFAELNCITKKTLRLYREMGLIKPARIDEETGYCYYSLEQCSTLDMIQQLQVLGVPLAQIGELAANGARGLLQTLKERRAAIDDQIVGLLASRQNVDQLIDNCRWVHRDPLYNVPIVEHLPARSVLMFNILHPEAARLDDDVARFKDAWEINLRLTKRAMLDAGVPATLFPHVGCSMDRDHLLRRDYTLKGAFVFVDDPAVAARYGAQELPAGDYVTLYKPDYTERGTHNAEISGLDAVLDFIAANGFSVAGDYFGQIVADTPAFHYQGREMLFKLTVPIRLD